MEDTVLRSGEFPHNEKKNIEEEEPSRCGREGGNRKFHFGIHNQKVYLWVPVSQTGVLVDSHSQTLLWFCSSLQSS